MLPRRPASRLFAAALILLALAALLGDQGARLGPWRLSPIPSTWIGLAVLAGLLLPPTSDPARGKRVLLAALALGTLAWPLLAWRRAVAHPPVPVTTRVGRPGPADARLETAVLPDLVRLRHAPPWHRLLGRTQEFTLDLEVWVWAPSSGTYRLELDADDLASLEVDGRPLLHEVERAVGELRLEEGPHALRVRHVQGQGAARLALDWDRPAWLELLPLQAYLSARPEGLAAVALRRRHLGALFSLLGALAWSLMAGLLVARAGESRHAWPAVQKAGRRIRARWSQLWSDPARGGALLTAGAAGLFMTALEAVYRPSALDGLYFQAFTSEYLMQTVSVADLRDEPWRSLFYLHIQPPALDALRALLVRLSAGGPTDRALVRGVDAGLYVAWGLVYVALVALAGRWLARLAPVPAALAAAALLALHPATIFYATMLDSTLLSAFLLSWLTYEMWRLSRGEGSPRRLAAAGITLFLTRSVFQWPFLVVLLAGLWLAGVPWRRTLRAVVPVALVMAVYMGKQYALFGVTLTSTFAADSFCKGLAAYCQGNLDVPRPPLPDPAAARVLSRTQKTNGEYNYNQLAFLRRSFSQMEEYRGLLRRTPIREIVGAWSHNLALYLQPSSRYSPHVIVDRLPWRGAYDRVFSGGGLVLLLVLTAGTALTGPGRVPPRRALGLALPLAYVFAVTIVFEGGENMRYKFFVEPVLYVFVAAQALRAGGRLFRLRSTPPGPRLPTAPAASPRPSGTSESGSCPWPA